MAQWPDESIPPRLSLVTNHPSLLLIGRSGQSGRGGEREWTTGLRSSPVLPEAGLVDSDVGIPVEVLLMAIGADLALEVWDADPPAGHADTKRSGQPFDSPAAAVGAPSESRHVERFADTRM